MGEHVTPLRGRVVLRPIEPKMHGMLHLPDTTYDTRRGDDKSRGMLARSSHRGIVLAKGPPALKYGHEVPHLFEVGDEVVFVFGSQGVEEGRRKTWTDGEPCVWVTQEEVQAVIA